MSTVVGVLSFRIGVDLYLQSYGYYSHCRHPLFDLHHVADITCFWKRSNKQRAVYSLSGAKLASMGLFQIYTIYICFACNSVRVSKMYSMRTCAPMSFQADVNSRLIDAPTPTATCFEDNGLHSRTRRMAEKWPTPSHQ